ncbi:MAG: ankyrin repeat domain-containing protein [Nitrospinae bacterium]|nr:ankyrin repeat domain-containing protein [Nitrospinota bacterium]
MQICSIVRFVVTAALLWTLAGVPQEAYGQSGGTPALESAEASLELTRSERRRIQMGLAAEGFDPGLTDGLFGLGTRGAIRAWQGSRGKAATGYLDAEAARALLTAGEKREAKSAVKKQDRNADVDRVDTTNEILRDKYVLGLSKALKADDYPKALAFMDKLQRLGGDLPPSVEYFRGEAYFNTKRYIKADKALNRYLSRTGKKGRYYRKSLELLLAIEERRANERDEDGNTPLHHAAGKDNYEVVTNLIALGVDVNAKNKAGSTPLHRAAQNNAREVAALLIKAGADVRAKRSSDSTPLHDAAENNAREVAALLIDAGADVNAKTKSGRTPLHNAARKGARGMAALLVKSGANVNLKRKNGKTLLHVAAQNNSRDMAVLLIGLGAEVNAKDKKRRTPLHYAAQNNARDVAVLLIKAGADVNAKTDYGWTPLRWARHRTMRTILRRYGGRK